MKYTFPMLSASQSIEKVKNTQSRCPLFSSSFQSLYPDYINTFCPISPYISRPSMLSPYLLALHHRKKGCCLHRRQQPFLEFSSVDSNYNYIATTLTALSFLESLGSCSVSKETFWPSSRVLKPSLWIAEKCTNTSSPPSSLLMKP